MRKRTRRRVRPLRLLRFIALIAILGGAAYGAMALVRAVQEAFPSTPHRMGMAPIRPTVPRPVHLTIVPGPWLPQPLTGAAAAYQAGQVVIAGGLRGGTISIGWVMRLEGRRVAQVGELPTPSHDATLTLTREGLVYAGGGEVVAEPHVWQLGWKNGRVTAQTLPALPEPLSDLTAVRWRSGLVVAGGYTGSQISDRLWFVSGRGVHALGHLIQGLRYAAAVKQGSTMFVFGGETAAGLTAQVEAVDLETGKARVCGALPVPVQKAMAFSLHQRLYVAGGLLTSGAPTDRVYRFVPDQCRLVQVGRLPMPLAYAAVASMPSGAILAGGEGPNGPTAGTWRVAATGTR